MNSPPKEEGRTEDAARSELTDPTTVVNEFRKINSAVPSLSMISEGWQLFHQWGNTGKPEALVAFCRHVNALRSRMKMALDTHS